jgi:hypothetical protein
MSLRDALAYAQDGWAVVPVNSNKRIPISNEIAEERGWIPKGGKGGVYLGSTDPVRVGEMWAEFPHCGVAASMGGSDLIAIDDDTEKKGETEGPGVDFLKRHHEELWSTRVHTTQGGGRHFIFEAEGRPLKSGPVTSTIDVKSRGGYVVLPPSAGYKVLKDLPPQPMSRALRADLRRLQEEYRPAGMNKGTSEATNEELIEAILTGKDFHDATLHLTKNWAVEGVSLEERRERIDEIYRRSELANPDHPDHQRWLDRYSETWRTSDKAEKYREISLDELHEMWSGVEPLPEASPLKKEVPPVPPVVSTLFKQRGDIKDEASPWLIEGTIREGGTLGVVGVPQIGKTTLSAGWIAGMLAGRTDVYGLSKIGRPLNVAWANAEESSTDMLHHVSAAQQEHGLDELGELLILGEEQIDHGGAGLDIITEMPNPETGRKEIVRNTALINQFIEELNGSDIDILIIDPVTEFNGGEENSRYDARLLNRAFKEIAQATGVAVIYWSHTGKQPEGKRPDWYQHDMYAQRGSSQNVGSVQGMATLAPLLPTQQHQTTAQGEEKLKPVGAEAATRMWREAKAGYRRNLITFTTVKMKRYHTLPQHAYEITPSKMDNDIPVVTFVPPHVAEHAISPVAAATAEAQKTLLTEALVRALGEGRHSRSVVNAAGIEGFPTNMRGKRPKTQAILAHWREEHRQVVDRVPYAVHAVYGDDTDSFVIEVRVV